MRLFQRIGDIVAANLNDLVDRFEDPEMMLKQAIREMETMIEKATGGAAPIAGERLLAKDLSDHQRKRSHWKSRAEQAVIDGDDDLARQAIARAHEDEIIAEAMLEQRTSAEQTARALRGQVSAMKAKQAEARRKLASLSARRQVVQNGRALRRSVRESSCGTTGFARFDKMTRQIEQAGAEAEALGDLDGNVSWSLDAAIESREEARRVEAELAKIKERLRESPRPV